MWFASWGCGKTHFRLTVSLYVKVTTLRPRGTAVADAMTPPRIHMLERFRVRLAEGGASMNPFKDWSRFFFGPISARPLGVFRIVFGVLILHLPGA